MNTVIEIVIKCAGIILLALCTYVVVPAIRDWRNNKLTASQKDQLTFWITVGVRWAKQWLYDSSNEDKKAAVMDYVRKKVQELGLPFSDEDIDKGIEAIYSTVKDAVDAAAGTDVISLTDSV